MKVAANKGYINPCDWIREGHRQSREGSTDFWNFQHLRIEPGNRYKQNLRMKIRWKKKKEIKRKTAYFYRIVKRNAKIFSDVIINNIETCTFFKAHFLKTLNTFIHLFEHSIEI